jgi:hypothetical protein
MTTLDRLRQPHPGREHQGRTPPLSRRLRVPIDLTNRPSIDRPSITDPGHAPPARCALARLRHHLRRDLILRRPTSPQNESPGPGSNIPNAGPPRPPRRLDLQPPDTFFDKRPESIHLDLAQMQVVDQDLSNVSSDLRESEQVILSAHTRCRHTTYELALLSIIL